MPNPPIDISSLAAQSNLSSEIQAKLSSALDAAINKTTDGGRSSSSASSSSHVEAAATAIDEACPRNEDAESFLWSLWNLLIGISKHIPLGDERINRLVGIVTSLKAKQGAGTVDIWASSHSLWSDMPLFGAVMREAWNGNPDFNDSPEDATKTAQWLSLNTFAARLLGASVQSWTNLALWELRDGLEEPLPSGQARDTHLTAASEWIVQAGRVLYAEVRNKAQLDERHVRALGPGSMLEGGSSGFNRQRWAFWKKRLQELSGEASGTAKARTQQALEVMSSLEAGTI
ncbi:hypothetical protein BBK36DRAFT_1157184 [Trichoderma citrinoviride]|uniref:Uncharacterized protein n=1 Tax=Trichoderma citrinoviride TaxID=58853 RepID=A0A2T4BHZ2_9HYPO|nr:hypothetical protein BBK36DRAFT_1157184 [Trichoderma citrinoviride]PTB68946.1 hypothetical protein BBK36DRAFT_1157184 [Trichoderma citrinoviride]